MNPNVDPIPEGREVANRLDEIGPPSNPKNQRNGVNVISQISQSFSGPLPPPQVLASYDQILPGCAERIIKMAEEQGLHRRAIETEQQRTVSECVTRSFAEATLLMMKVQPGR